MKYVILDVNELYDMIGIQMKCDKRGIINEVWDMIGIWMKDSIKDLYEVGDMRRIWIKNVIREVYEWSMW